MADVPHLRVPLEFVGGKLAVVEQDSTEEVTQCVEAVLRYRKGERLTRPSFGVGDLTFRPILPSGLRVDDLAAALEEHEPRLGVLIEQSAVSSSDAIMGVALRVRMTGGATDA